MFTTTANSTARNTISNASMSIMTLPASPYQIPLDVTSNPFSEKNGPQPLNATLATVRREHHRDEHREAYGQKRFPHVCRVLALPEGPQARGVAVRSVVKSCSRPRLQQPTLRKASKNHSAPRAAVRAMPILRESALRLCVTSLAGVGRLRNRGRSETILIQAAPRARGDYSESHRPNMEIAVRFSSQIDSATSGSIPSLFSRGAQTALNNR
jgi:hypothetical protein